jgi:hypothetical protein
MNVLMVLSIVCLITFYRLFVGYVDEGTWKDKSVFPQSLGLVWLVSFKPRFRAIALEEPQIMGSPGSTFILLQGRKNSCKQYCYNACVRETRTARSHAK